ncbi:MAG: gliding motility-associated C-terminal domain-containing protein [Bacteroidota bacterium]
MKRLFLILSLIAVLMSSANTQIVDTICPNDPQGRYRVSGMANSSYFWTATGGQIVNTNGADSIEVLWDLNASSHLLNVIELSEHGCVGDTVYGEVLIASPPVADIYGPDSVCENQHIILTASNAQSYLWSGGQTGSAIQINVVSDTVVSLRVDDGCGTDSTQHKIIALPRPDAGFSVLPAVPRVGKTSTFTADSSAAPYFAWLIDGDTLNNQQSLVYHTFYQSGLYEVMLYVENHYGCFDTSSAIVEVRDLMVNTITPNGDGINDVWNIPELDGNDRCEVRIFDRWNGEIFFSKGYHKPWDGTYQGEAVPEGSYFYVIDYNDGTEPAKGVITIIR